MTLLIIVNFVSVIVIQRVASLFKVTTKELSFGLIQVKSFHANGIFYKIGLLPIFAGLKFADSRYDQIDEDGFDDEALEVNLDFDDPADEENYYLVKVKAEDNMLPVMFDISDEFTNGNLISVYYEREEDEDINQVEFATGDIVDIEFYGVSKQFHDYIRLLIEQYESVGDPFSSTPVALKGNCVSITNPNNYAHGYFRLTQVVKTTYTFQ